jgi:hypothetical protein
MEVRKGNVTHLEDIEVRKRLLQRGREGKEGGRRRERGKLNEKEGI